MFGNALFPQVLHFTAPVCCCVVFFIAKSPANAAQMIESNRSKTILSLLTELTGATT